MTAVQVTLLYFDGCPNWHTAAERLEQLAAEQHFQVHRRKVSTPQEAEEVGFLGSPSILIDGRDPFAGGDEPVGLSCRVYATDDGPQGAPSLAQLRTALTQAAS